MRHQYVRALGATALLLMLLTPWGRPERAMACSCVFPSSASDARVHADAVFVGRVLDTRVKDSGSKKHRVDIDRIWKGELRPQETVHTGQGAGDCGYSFQVDQDYLFYAYWPGDSEKLSTDICTGTMPLSEASEHLAELDQLATSLVPAAESIAVPAAEATAVPAATSMANAGVRFGEEQRAGWVLGLGALLVGALTVFGFLWMRR